MALQTNLSIEWEGALTDDQARAITADLQSISEGVAELHTEKALGGLELVVTTIIIGMATKVGEKIVEAVWSAIASLCKSGAANGGKTMTLNATWDSGEAKIVLPLDRPEELKKRLTALGDLISAS